jgi:ABC-type branched-subunit amino acid transport system substrate-binding protein
VAACGSSSKKAATAPSSSAGSAAPVPTAAAASQFPAIPAGPIKFGISASLSGAGAAYGLNAQKQFSVSMSLFNAAHPDGIDGHKVQLDIIDDASEVTKAVGTAQQFVANKDAFVWKLSDNPDAATQQVQIFTKAKLPSITYSVPANDTNPAQFPYVFSSLNSAQQSGQATAQWIAQHPEFKTIGLLTDGSEPDVAFANGILNPLKSLAPSVQVVKTASIPTGSVDPAVAVSQLKSANPDLLLVALGLGYGPIWQAIQATNWSPSIVTSAGAWYDGFNAMGPLATKAYAAFDDCVTAGHPPFPTDITSDMDGYIGALGESTINYLTYINSGLMEFELAKLAIEKYHSIDPNALKQALEGMTNQTVLGIFQYSFSPTNHFGLTGQYGEHVCHMSPFVDGKYKEPTIAP